MFMKLLWSIIILLVGLLAGCTTAPTTSSQSHDEEIISTIRNIYKVSRTMKCQVTNGMWAYDLILETNLVDACQTLLLNFSESANSNICVAAAYHLLHFGTKPAFDRGIQLAHGESAPEDRAKLWRLIILLLLHEPEHFQMKGMLAYGGTNMADDSNEVMQIFSMLSDPIFFSNSDPQLDFIRPPGVEPSRIEREIISQYEQDNGSWTVVIEDKIPYVPFYVERREVIRTVREVIAETIQKCACGNSNLLTAFQTFSTNQNPAISGPAKDVVEALREWEKLGKIVPWDKK
jgi:hypothetical protein